MSGPVGGEHHSIDRHPVAALVAAVELSGGFRFHGQGINGQEMLRGRPDRLFFTGLQEE